MKSLAKMMRVLTAAGPAQNKSTDTLHTSSSAMSSQDLNIQTAAGLKKIILYLEIHLVNSDGIFSRAGSIEEVSALVEFIQHNTLSEGYLTTLQNIHSMAMAIKEILSTYSPLIPTVLYNDFVSLLVSKSSSSSSSAAAASSSSVVMEDYHKLIKTIQDNTYHNKNNTNNNNSTNSSSRGGSGSGGSSNYHYEILEIVMSFLWKLVHDPRYHVDPYHLAKNIGVFILRQDVRDTGKVDFQSQLQGFVYLIECFPDPKYQQLVVDHVQSSLPGGKASVGGSGSGGGVMAEESSSQQVGNTINTSEAYTIQDRSVKLSFSQSVKPTDNQLRNQLTKYGEITNIGFKEKFAVILFVSPFAAIHCVEEEEKVGVYRVKYLGDRERVARIQAELRSITAPNPAAAPVPAPPLLSSSSVDMSAVRVVATPEPIVQANSATPPTPTTPDSHHVGDGNLAGYSTAASESGESERMAPVSPWKASSRVSHDLRAESIYGIAIPGDMDGSRDGEVHSFQHVDPSMQSITMGLADVSAIGGTNLSHFSDTSLHPPTTTTTTTTNPQSGGSSGGVGNGTDSDVASETSDHLTNLQAMREALLLHRNGSSSVSKNKNKTWQDEVQEVDTLQSSQHYNSPTPAIIMSSSPEGRVKDSWVVGKSTSTLSSPVNQQQQQQQQQQVPAVSSLQPAVIHTAVIDRSNSSNEDLLGRSTSDDQIRPSGGSGKKRHIRKIQVGSPGSQSLESLDNLTNTAPPPTKNKPDSDEDSYLEEQRSPEYLLRDPMTKARDDHLTATAATTATAGVITHSLQLSQDSEEELMHSMKVKTADHHHLPTMMDQMQSNKRECNIMVEEEPISRRVVDASPRSLQSSSRDSPPLAAPPLVDAEIAKKRLPTVTLPAGLIWGNRSAPTPIDPPPENYEQIDAWKDVHIQSLLEKMQVLEAQNSHYVEQVQTQQEQLHQQEMLWQTQIIHLQMKNSYLQQSQSQLVQEVQSLKLELSNKVAVIATLETQQSAFQNTAKQAHSKAQRESLSVVLSQQRLIKTLEQHIDELKKQNIRYSEELQELHQLYEKVVKETLQYKSLALQQQHQIQGQARSLPMDLLPMSEEKVLPTDSTSISNTPANPTQDTSEVVVVVSEQQQQQQEEQEQNHIEENMDQLREISNQEVLNYLSKNAHVKDDANGVGRTGLVGRSGGGTGTGTGATVSNLRHSLSQIERNEPKAVTNLRNSYSLKGPGQLVVRSSESKDGLPRFRDIIDMVEKPIAPSSTSPVISDILLRRPDLTMKGESLSSLRQHFSSVVLSQQQATQPKVNTEDLRRDHQHNMQALRSLYSIDRGRGGSTMATSTTNTSSSSSQWQNYRYS
eukprot:scaffold2613_cov159-Ochromonas_danica.AAC.2